MADGLPRSTKYACCWLLACLHPDKERVLRRKCAVEDWSETGQDRSSQRQSVVGCVGQVDARATWPSRLWTSAALRDQQPHSHTRLPLQVSFPPTHSKYDLCLGIAHAKWRSSQSLQSRPASTSHTGWVGGVGGSRSRTGFVEIVQILAIVHGPFSLFSSWLRHKPAAVRTPSPTSSGRSRVRVRTRNSTPVQGRKFSTQDSWQPQQRAADRLVRPGLCRRSPIRNPRSGGRLSARRNASPSSCSRGGHLAVGARRRRPPPQHVVLAYRVEPPTSLSLFEIETAQLSHCLISHRPE